MDWLTIISTVVGLIFMVGGGIVGYLLKGAKVAKEVGDLLTVAGGALEDKQLTPAEIANILKEAEDVKQAIAAFKASK